MWYLHQMLILSAALGLNLINKTEIIHNLILVRCSPQRMQEVILTTIQSWYDQYFHNNSG